MSFFSSDVVQKMVILLIEISDWHIELCCQAFRKSALMINLRKKERVSDPAWRDSSDAAVQPLPVNVRV